MIIDRVSCVIAVLISSLYCLDLEGAMKFENVQEDVYLVNGVVTNVGSASSSLIPVTIRIDAVYYGPVDLIGRFFADHASQELPPGRGHCIVPVPERGAEGIWAIKTNGNEIILWRGFANKLWPSLAKSDSRYAEAKSLAQAVRSIEDMPAKEDKTKLFVEYAFSRVPEISQWATRALFDSERVVEKTVVDAGVPKSSLPVLGKLVADEMLAIKSGESWTLSQDRYKMLLSMADGSMDSLESEKFSERLQAIAQTKYEAVPEDVLVSIVEKTTGNKELSAKCRTSSLYALQYLLRKSGNEKAVELLIDKVEKETPEMARTATVILRYNAKPNEQQQARLRKAKEKVLESRRVKDIDDILAAWNARSKQKP